MLAAMVDAASVAQARSLLVSLHDHVDQLSEKIATAEHRLRQRTPHGASLRYQSSRLLEMRTELYEAHRLIGNLHRRFPAARESWPNP